MTVPTMTNIEEAIASIRTLLDTPLLAGRTDPGDLAEAYFDDDIRNALSGGERVLLGVIVAIWNGRGGIEVADLLTGIDTVRFAAVINALCTVRGM